MVFEVSDGAPADEKAAATAAANTAKTKTAAKVTLLMGQHPQLLADVQKLKSVASAASTVAALEKLLTDGKAALSKFASLKGSNNPKTQLWVNYGKQQHIAMASSHGCDVADKAFALLSGSDGRPDCIKFKRNRCEILEFEPNSKSEIAKGQKQLAKYLPAVTAYYQKLWDDHRKSADDKYGKDKYKTCVNGNGKVVFSTVPPKTYEKCALGYQCVQP